ncbi:trehalose/maltose hydrolase-like predicted phosphorylase [Streptacidiphilus sp. EB103A]
MGNVDRQSRPPSIPRRAAGHAEAASGYDPWTLRYQGYDAAEEGLREALCAVGNGYVVSRGAAPESIADGVHYPGTYLAGCYDRATSFVQGRSVENEDLVNVPNWLPLTFRAEQGAWLGAPGPCDQAAGIHDQQLELDLRRGVLTRRATVVDAFGRRTGLVQRRIAHMGQPHLLALETVLVPENWSGRLDIRCAIDGTVANTGVARYQGLADSHLHPVDQGADGSVLWLQARARGSPLCIAMAARTEMFQAGCPLPVARADSARDGWVAQVITATAVAGEAVTVQKIVAVFTSRDPAVDDPLRAARRLVTRAEDFEALLRSHTLRWAQLWRRCRIEADFSETGPLHLYLFHLLQTVSEHSADLDVGVPARGLHGEG